MTTKELHFIDKCAALVPLEPWIALAEAVKIPFIPAVFSPRFKLHHVMYMLDGEDREDVVAAMDWVNNVVTGTQLGRMVVRWESCSSSWIKSDCAAGKGWNPEWAKVHLDDPRCAEGPPFGASIADSDGCTRFVVRPYVKPLLVGGYPLEFRVYIDEQGRSGVSNYYPQRPLDREHYNCDTSLEMVLSLARCAEIYGNRLVSTLIDYGVGFTADFLVDEDLKTWFLEGGPPHHQGAISAHPCCFKPGKCRGMALVPQDGALVE